MVIQTRLPQPDWEKGKAACVSFPPQPRNPITGKIDKDGDPAFYDAREFLPVCNGDYTGTPCPMRDYCGLWALINNDQHGVFGGMTAPQRKWVRQNVSKDFWNDSEYLLRTVPGPGYFTDYGDDMLCDSQWGPGLGAGHTCECNQTGDHDLHGCGCGAIWTDEEEIGADSEEARAAEG